MPKKLKISIIGAGSSYTPEFVYNVIKFYKNVPVTELMLIDLENNEKHLKTIYDFSKQMLDKAKLKINLTYSTNRKVALVDSHYVVIQIRVGKMESRLYDETLPAEYGLLGHETFGIGGLFNALRTVPVIFDIIEDVKDVCPQAWVLNVTNPTGIISEAIFRYSEFDRFIGVCSDPVQITNDLAEALGAPKEEIIPYFAGINHLSFVTNLYWNHKDWLPKILKNDEMLQKFKYDKTYLKNLETYPHIDFDYYINYDEILADYLNDIKNGKIRANEVMKVEKTLFDHYSNLANDYDPELMKLRNGKDYSLQCLDIISGIHNNSKEYMVLDTINRGHITDLSEDCAIEITCRITDRGPLPVHIGRLPLQIRGVIQHVKSYEELLVDAIYEKNINKALMAFQNHPHTTSFKQTKKAFDALYEKNKSHLGYYGEYKK
ncbi:6-phospho-beta-glucosidase [Acholeplasma hippikon]|nr:6-phospho-beta-glucosidase [Acholeplasma hippikon]